MQIDIIADDKKTILRLHGRFDFSAHRDFRAGADNALNATHAGNSLVVDFGAVDYLDSSALGMLLVLRDKAQAASKTVTLANCRGSVAQVLEIARFKTLFNML